MSKATPLPLASAHRAPQHAPGPARAARKTGMARVDAIFESAFGWLASGGSPEDFNRKV